MWSPLKHYRYIIKFFILISVSETTNKMLAAQFNAFQINVVQTRFQLVYTASHTSVAKDMRSNRLVMSLFQPCYDFSGAKSFTNASWSLLKIKFSKNKVVDTRYKYCTKSKPMEVCTFGIFTFVVWNLFLH